MYRLLVVLPLLITACSFVDRRNDTTVTYQGGGMNPAVWDAIREGETDRQWLLRYIGPPARIETVAAGKEIYHYPYQREDYQRTRIFLIYNNQQTQTHLVKQSVMLQDGVVVKRWQEPEPLPPQTLEPASDQPAEAPEAGTVTPEDAAPEQQAVQQASGLVP